MDRESWRAPGPGTAESRIFAKELNSKAATAGTASQPNKCQTPEGTGTDLLPPAGALPLEETLGASPYEFSPDPCFTLSPCQIMKAPSFHFFV